MQYTMAEINQPNFEKINKYNVTIMSLKNQLKASTNIDELTMIAGKIIELEHQIIVEKTAGYKSLEKERKEIENKIDKIRRELKRAEDELARVDGTLDFKLNGYRIALQNRIEVLSDEYNEIAKHIV
jgi:septal ring factor EnvC (AmiA/AmiB activator)